MVTSYGTGHAHIGGTTHRPLPRPGDRSPLAANAPSKPKPTGLDWSKHRAPEPAAPSAEAAPAPVAVRGKRAAKPPAPPKVKREPKPPREPKPRRSVGRPPAVDGAIVVARYTAGQTIPRIADELDTWPANVRRALLRAGVELRDDRSGHSGGRNAKSVADYPPADVETFRRLYVDELQPLTAIAATSGRSAKYVTNVLHAAGVTLRPAAHIPRGERVSTGEGTGSA